MPLIRFGLLGLLLWRTVVALSRLRRGLNGKPLRWRDRDLQILVERDKRRVTGVRVGIELPDRFRFVLRREAKYDAVAKWLGLAAEIQTGDERFDERVFVIAEDDALRRALCGDRELRDLVCGVFDDDDARSLRCNAGLLWVDCKSSGQDRDTDDEDAIDLVAARHVDDLDRIAARLAATNALRWNDERGRAEVRESWLYGICIALGAAALAGFLWSEGTGFPRLLAFDHAEASAALFALATGASLAVAAVLLLAGTPRLHLVLLEIVLGGAPASFFVARTALAEYGIHASQPPPRTVVVRIDDREVVRGRRGRRSYYLHLSGWPDPGLDGRLKVDAALYGAAANRDCLAVHWSDGRLGDPWIAAPQPVACDAERF